MTSRAPAILAALVVAAAVPVAVSGSAGALSQSFPAVADAKVESKNPQSNFGTGTSLRADSSPRVEGYLRFNVSGLTGSPQQATVRLFAIQATGDGPEIFATETDWTETAITFDLGRPARTSGSLDDRESISSGTFVDFDVTSAVGGNGVFSFNLSPTSSDGLTFGSREASTSTNRPQLILTTADGPDTIPPDTVITTGPSGTVTTTSVTFTFSSTEANSTFECRMDGASFNACSSPKTYSGLTEGAHALDVRATDAANNTDPVPARRTFTVDTSGGTQVLVGAGDIASCAHPGDEATAKLLDAISGTVFTTADNVYENATAAEFADCYGPTWGRHKARTGPSIGNHEYHTSGASGYFDYFGAGAGDPAKGYYSYDLGAWHVVVLNSNCSLVAGGCKAGSPQEQWLRADLAASAAACTVAYWHHPRFSSGSAAGSSTATSAFWDALYERGAEVVMVGHEHNYERFAPQSPAGVADPSFGIRQFVVGTGGRSFHPFATTIVNSEVRNNNTFGVLKLSLHAASYDWEFVPEAGRTFTDSGTQSCHGAPAGPPSPAGPTFTAEADARLEEANPNTNFGSATTLSAQGGSDPDMDSYLRFTVSGISGTVTGARLRLYVSNGTNDGPAVYSTSNDWTESGITWANRPGRSSDPLDDKGAAAAGSFLEYDVTPLVTGNGTFSLVLASSAADSLGAYSRERSSNRPQLIVTTDPPLN